MIKRIIERISKVKPSTAARVFLILSALLLASAITLTVFFAIDKSKYQTAHGTYLSSPETGSSIRYVINGEGYVESIRNVPGSWKNGELVEIEYIEDKPGSVRAIRTATPYVIAIIASIAATGWAVYIFRKYSLPKTVVTKNNDNAPTEIGGYYS